MDREPSSSSPAVSPLALFGWAHTTRSPFQWDRPQDVSLAKTLGCPVDDDVPQCAAESL